MSLALAVCAAGASAPAFAAGEPPWAQGVSRAEDLEIELVTFGPGSDVMSYFGHDALVVRDKRFRTSRLYNFGMFSFSRETLGNYLKGRLDFWVGVRSLMGTYARYLSTNRSITVQRLKLTPKQAMQLAVGLETAVLPHNRTYRYHHYRDNCSTRVRDHLDRVLGGQLSEAGKAPGRMDLRGHTRRHSAKQPVVDFALRFWMNASMEAPITVWQEMFLPGEVQRVVEELGLSAHTQRLFEADRPPIPEEAPSHGPWLLLLGLAWGGLVWGLGTRRNTGRAWRLALGGLHSATGLFFGFLGTLGALMWGFTEWAVTYDNANQLLANPVTLLAFPLGIAVAFGSQRAQRWLYPCWRLLAFTSALAGIACLLSVTDQANAAVIALLLPINAGFALSLRPGTGGAAREDSADGGVEGVHVVLPLDVGDAPVPIDEDLEREGAQGLAAAAPQGAPVADVVQEDREGQIELGDEST